MAVFNLSDGSVMVAADIGKAIIRDLWSRGESGTVDGFLEVEFPPNGADLYRLCLTS